MNLEELQGMSDAELNRLSAVKVMGWTLETRSGYIDNNWVVGDKLIHISKWNPTTDMNDCHELFQVMILNEKYSDATITYPWCVVANHCVNDDTWEPHWSIKVEDDSLPKAITIASILAKEE